MKQKQNLTGRSWLRSLLLLVFAVTALVPISFSQPKVAEAEDLCSNITINVEVYDVTAGALIGNYFAADEEGYEVNIPYNHVIRYTFDTEGTPSFTAGRYYNSGSYYHSEHTYYPDPTPGMSDTWTAPAITQDAFFFAQVYENFCTENPPYYGDDSARVDLLINVTGGGSPSPTIRTGTSNLAVVTPPSVSFLGKKTGTNDIPASSLYIGTGDSVDLSWATNSVNNGNSCTGAYTSNPAVTINGWNGPVNGPGGGNLTIGPFNTEGFYSFSAFCLGWANASTAVQYVTVQVGPGADIMCWSMGGNPATLTRGGSRIDQVQVQPREYNGLPFIPYDNDVVVSGSFSPSTANPPSLSIVPGGPTDVSAQGLHNFVATVSTNTTTDLGSYTITYIVTDAVTGVVRSCGTQPLIVQDEDPPILNPPTNVFVDNSTCGQLTITWDPPSPLPDPLPTYNIYRRTGNGSFVPGDLLATNVTSPYVNSQSDPNFYLNTLYYYGVTAYYGVGQETLPPTQPLDTPKQASPCTSSLLGSYKSLVGAGNTEPSISFCSGPATTSPLPDGQVFESGDTVYFEVCVDARQSATALTNVRVVEPFAGTHNLEDIEFVRAGGGKNPCATPGNPGEYFIGTMDPNSLPPTDVCGLLFKAKISNPGGPASSLHYFVDWANIVSDQLSQAVNSSSFNFIISSDEPTRTETPR